MHLNDGRVVSNFIVQALKEKPITIYGEGLQTRSFCYVSDLVDGLIKMMNTPSETTGPINLGNPVEVTIVELAKLVIDIVKSKSELVYMPLPTDDPMKRKPDISLAQEHLGWQPIVNLELGLAETIKDFDQRLQLRK